MTHLSVDVEIKRLSADASRLAAPSLDIAVGTPGPQGIKGDQGIKGEIGDTGLTGPEGPIGLDGPQGDKGDTGDTGLTGPEGPIGLQGDQGDKGEIGNTGPTGDTGPLGPQGSQGVQGPQGAATLVQGHVPDWTAPNIPADPVSGDMWILDDPLGAPGRIYDGSPAQAGDGMVWDGTAWFNAGPMSGADGAQGPEGADGATGPQGDPGTTLHGGLTDITADQHHARYTDAEVVVIGDGVYLRLDSANGPLMGPLEMRSAGGGVLLVHGSGVVQDILTIAQGAGSWSYQISGGHLELRATIASPVFRLFGGLDVKANLITNVADPVAIQDAATKGYVDTSIGSIPTPIADHGDLTGVTTDQHHTKYTDAEAVTAVGPHTVKYTDAEAVTAVGPHTVKYTDAEAITAGATTYVRLDSANSPMFGPLEIKGVQSGVLVLNGNNFAQDILTIMQPAGGWIYRVAGGHLELRPTVEGRTHKLFGSIDMTTLTIVNVGDPVNPQDAATKSYVDGAAAVTSTTSVSDDEPTGPEIGDLWITATAPKEAKHFDGSEWV